MRFVFAFILITASVSFAQQSTPTPPVVPSPTGEQNQTSNPPQPQAGVVTLPDAPSTHAANKEVDPTKQQPKRILGIMPNYRAVSAGSRSAATHAQRSLQDRNPEQLRLLLFIFVGLTSLIAEGNDSHPALGKGIGGFWGYYWRGFVDKTDGNDMVVFVMPTIFHQDERYYAMGEGPFLKRAVYAASRILITPNYSGNNSFNASEIFGRAVAQGISASYYPAEINLRRPGHEVWMGIGPRRLTNVFRDSRPRASQRTCCTGTHNPRRKRKWRPSQDAIGFVGWSRPPTACIPSDLRFAPALPCRSGWNSTHRQHSGMRS